VSAGAFKEKLRADLKQAMRARNAGEVAALRSMIGALDNAEAVPIAGGRDRMVQRAFGDPEGEVPRRELDEEEIAALLDAEIAARQRAIEEYVQGGRSEEAARLTEEARLIAAYRVP
jgi:uncharacterized protein YqeY